MIHPLSADEIKRFIPLQTPGPFDHDQRMPGPPVTIDLSLPDRCIALLGDRGSGKTTLLRWLAATASNQIILLDDVDSAEAESWAREFPASRIFATTTTWIPGFITREILPFGQPEIWTYLQSQRELRGVLERNPELMDLAATPAILAEMANMAARAVQFPQQRAELYAWVVKRLGPIAHPAIRLFVECCQLKTPPTDRERLCLFGAIEWARGGKTAVDQLVATACAAIRPPVECVANLYALESDLIPVGYRIESDEYRSMVLAMTALFEDTLEAAAIPLRTKVAAAEALGRAGDPRLRLPSAPDYWARIDCLEFGRFPVTVHEFAEYVRATGYNPDYWAKQQAHPSRPVTGVNWFIAQDYCHSIGGRLPEEAEWMRSLAGRYAWGDDEPDPGRGNFNSLGLNVPTPVGLFPRGNNRVAGISDLQGNVWEWTATGATAGDYAGMKIQLGNSCHGYPGKIRGWNDGARGHEVIGFRCVRDIPLL